MRHASCLKVTLLLASLALASPWAQAGVGFLQLPDMVAGTDTLSMHRSLGPVVVDDYVVDKPQILGVRWWGSYFQDAGQSHTVPRMVSFELSHHTDCPAGAAVSPSCPGDVRNPDAPQPYAYSTPGQPYSFEIVNAQETFFGTTAQGEDVYEYLVQFARPWAATPGSVAWIDIAWAAGQFGSDPLDAVWGWHESDQHHFDFAVQTDSEANAQLPLGSNPHLGPWNLLQGKDMAFQMLVAPEPSGVALVGLALFGALALRRKARQGTR